MSPSSQSHQSSYFPQIASDTMLQPAPRIASAYRRTLETYVDGGTQSGSIDLDTFDVPCPPSVPMPSPRSSRFASSDGLAMTAAATEKDNASSGARRGRKSGSGSGGGNQTPPSSSSATLSSSSAVGNVPDLGEVDLNDGKNEERPQRFKAVIHFQRKDPDSSGRLQQGGGAGRLPPSDGESYGNSP
ncbi:hypothetical protein FRC04_005714 [Tulasnella sp. 424]|nr:hypothetical protein FRC04_005714 [Tulasnella sp. 424]KAG8977509.1 hypothetical protein FRC05_001367 [Tulasnella sp. 425]